MKNSKLLATLLYSVYLITMFAIFVLLFKIEDTRVAITFGFITICIIGTFFAALLNSAKSIHIFKFLDKYKQLIP